MKLLRYDVGGFIVTAVLAWIIALGQAHGSRSLMAIAFVALFVVRLCEQSGWRTERYGMSRHPLVLLALFVPFSFLW